MEYSRDLHARAADELLLLPDPSALVEMMNDFAVMREQTQACRAIDDRS